MPFEKGKSGNPKGRPKGALARVPKEIRMIFEKNSAELANKAVELALEGDAQSIRLIIERLYPARKDLPVEFTLNKIETVSDLTKASESVLKAVAKGELTPKEAESVASLLDIHRRTIETANLEKRIEQLELSNDK
jgi:hypothetical protein